jgi:hypothetical protein
MIILIDDMIELILIFEYEKIIMEYPKVGIMYLIGMEGTLSIV